MHVDADMALIEYFLANIKKIETEWFNIITPCGVPITKLKEQLLALSQKTLKTL